MSNDIKGRFVFYPYMQRSIETLEHNYIKFEDHDIAVIIDNEDKVWFCGADITNALGYKYPKDAIQNNVDNDDKIKLELINTAIKIEKHPHSIFINESGLYSLIIGSKLKKAKQFKTWITSEVLPSIREFGKYKLKKKYEGDIGEIMTHMNLLNKQNKKMKDDLKKNIFPDGGIVYVVDYTEDNEHLDYKEGEGLYRIGKASNPKDRKKGYDTHSLHKKSMIVKFSTKYPIELEYCVRSMLYGYRYKNKKDFYVCKLDKIKKILKKCNKDIELSKLDRLQKGGGVTCLDNYIDKLEEEKSKLEFKLKILINEDADTGSDSSYDEIKKPKKVNKKKTAFDM